MGSWNETCALTKVAITAGEPVVLFILKGTFPEYVDLRRFFSDSEGLFSLAGLPLYGDYDDYGSIELDEDYADYHQCVFQASFAGNCTTKNLPDFLKGVERGRESDGDRGYNQMMIKRSAWEAITDAQAKNVSYFYVDGSVQEMTYDQRYRSGIATCVAMNVYSPGASDITNKNYDLERHQQSAVWERLAGSTLRTSLGEYVYADNANEKVVEVLRRTLLLNAALTSLRLGWIPQFGSGSQNADTAMVRVLAQQTLHECDALDTQYEG